MGGGLAKVGHTPPGPVKDFLGVDFLGKGFTAYQLALSKFATDT